MDIEDRISRLESDKHDLRVKLMRLEALQARGRNAAPHEIADRQAMPGARLDAQVSITQPPLASCFPMPTPDELAKLVDAVARCYPSLLETSGVAFEGTRHDRRAQWLKQFEGAFLAIGNMKRLERPSTKVYLSYHVQVAEKLLRSFGRPGMTLRPNVFLAAALAHFDVPVSGIGRHHEGIVPEIGLDEYVGRPATDQWRRILEGQAPLNPVRIHAQGY